MVDFLIVLFLVLALLGGWQQGLIVSSLAAIGWLTAVVLGIWATPRLLDLFGLRPESELNTLLLVLGCALVLGVIGAVLLGQVGQRAAGRLSVDPARAVDAALGAVAMGLVALTVAWAGVSSARPLLSDGATRQIRESWSWSLIDRAVPAPTRNVVASINKRFASSPFPEAFTGTTPQVDAPPPDGQAAAAPAVQRARKSILRIVSAVPQCGGTSVGTGWVVSKNRVVTNAHVVAGSQGVTVETGGPQDPRPAAVVAYDDQLDLAILRVPGLQAPPLPRADDLTRGTPVAAAGYPRGQGFRVSAGRIRSKADATGRDVYNDKPVDRNIYLVRTTIVPGNSGGPLLTKDGRVAGTVFAKSAINDNTAYALTDDATHDWLNLAPSLRKRVPTGECAPRPRS